MTRKDFEIIARFLKECRELAAWCMDNDEDFAAMVTLAENYFGGTNANFDSDKFRKACGVIEE